MKNIVLSKEVIEEADLNFMSIFVYISKDPKLISNFIHYVLNVLWKFYSPGGCWTLEQKEQIKALVSSSKDKIMFGHYDGKILNCNIGDVIVHMNKFDPLLLFKFKYYQVELYFDYTYVGDNQVRNESECTERYNSPVKGFESLLNVQKLQSELGVTLIVTEVEQEE